MTALGDLTWTDLDGRRPLLVLPLGSCEQHGPHLPLDTDTRIATALAGAAVARRDDAVLGPVLAIGASGEHAGFPGTLSIGTDVLVDVLVELVRSSDAFRATVVVNGHGGNTDALRRAERTATDEGRDLRVWSPTVAGGDAHAGHTETSLLLALAPDAVRADAIGRGDDTPLDRLLDRLREEGVRAVSPSGVLGDPTTASADEGRELFDRLVADLVACLDDWFPR